MARYLFLLLVLAVLAMGVFGALRGRGGPGPASPSPSRSAHMVRVAVQGRPGDVSVRALRRLPALGGVQLDIRPATDPGEAWQMLAAGELDLMLTTLDEFSLAVPRYNPGTLLFVSARSVGSDAVVVKPGLGQGAVVQVAYVDGTAGQYLAAWLASRHTEWRVQPVAARDPDEALGWLKRGSVQGVALWEPYVSDLEGEGYSVALRTTPSEPVTEVWVASRQALRGERAPRVNRQDIQAVAQAHFSLMAELRRQPGLALRALAEENGLGSNVGKLQARLQGLEFLTLQESQEIGESELVAQLEQFLTVWSLTGAPNTQKASYAGAIDFAVRNALNVPAVMGIPSTPAVPTPEDTGAPQESPTPAESMGPFAVPDSPSPGESVQPTPAGSDSGLEPETLPESVADPGGALEPGAAGAGEALTTLPEETGRPVSRPSATATAASGPAGARSASPVPTPSASPVPARSAGPAPPRSTAPVRPALRPPAPVRPAVPTAAGPGISTSPASPGAGGRVSATPAGGGARRVGHP